VGRALRELEFLLSTVPSSLSTATALSRSTSRLNFKNHNPPPFLPKTPTPTHTPSLTHQTRAPAPAAPPLTAGPQRHAHSIRHLVDADLQAPAAVCVKHNLLGIRGAHSLRFWMGWRGGVSVNTGCWWEGGGGWCEEQRFKLQQHQGGVRWPRFRSRTLLAVLASATNAGQLNANVCCLSWKQAPQTLQMPPRCVRQQRRLGRVLHFVGRNVLQRRSAPSSSSH